MKQDKSFSLFFFILFFPSIIFSAQPGVIKIPEGVKEFHLHQHVDNNVHGGEAHSGAEVKNNTSTTTEVQSSSESNATAENRVVVDLDFHLKQHIVHFYTTARDSMHASGQNIVEKLKENKWKIAAAMAAVTYGYFWYKIFKTNQILKQKNSWCNWKEAVALSSLMVTSQHDLMTELLQEIQKQQLLRQNLKDCSSGIVCFVKEITDELQLLQSYVQLYDMCRRFYCSKLFYFTIDYVLLQEKIARLYFLIDLFSFWQTKQYMSSEEK